MKSTLFLNTFLDLYIISSLRHCYISLYLLFISTKIKVHKLNGYLLLDIDRYTHLQMEIRSIIGDVESKEVKPDFRVISRVLNETGFCNRNNNPPARLDNGDEIAPEGAGRTENEVRAITLTAKEKSGSKDSNDSSLK